MPPSFATQIVFHRKPDAAYTDPWFPMHGTLFIQERADASTPVEQIVAEAALHPVLQKAAHLSYDDVTHLACEALACLATLCALLLLACCCACRACCRARKRRVRNFGKGWHCRLTYRTMPNGLGGKGARTTPLPPSSTPPLPPKGAPAPPPLLAPPLPPLAGAGAGAPLSK